MLPATLLKSEPSLHIFSFILSQNQSNGCTTGSTLWLGAQCLSAYIQQFHKPPNSNSTAIELGSGIGLSALVLSALGYSTVYATDTRFVIDTVLRRNIEANRSGSILVRELDWHIPPEHWNWKDDHAIASATQTPISPEKSLGWDLINTSDNVYEKGWDLIITSDTVYEPSLVQPLLRTLHALSSQSLAAKSRSPLILLCLERRDPLFIDSVLAQAREKWSFSTERVPARKLAKAMQKCASNWARDRSEWDDVEIWKLMLLTELTQAR